MGVFKLWPKTTGNYSLCRTMCRMRKMLPVTYDVNDEPENNSSL